MTESDRERISAFIEEQARLRLLLRDADAATARQLRRQLNAAESGRYEIATRLRDELAASRGWIVAKTSFNIEQLATQRRYGHRYKMRTADDSKLMDHPERFREARKPYRSVAILTHSYARDEEPFIELARELGLAVEFLDWSWYYPEHCIAALFIRM